MALSLTIFLCFAVVVISNGVPDNRGTEFLLAFMDNELALLREEDIPLELYVTTYLTSDVTVRVTSPAFLDSNGDMEVDETLTVTAGDVKCVVISYRLRLIGLEKTTKAIRVEADAEVAVYGLNKDIPSSSGAFLAFPVDVLGTEYVAVSVNPFDEYRSVIVLVGVEDNTQVSLTFRSVATRVALESMGSVETNQSVLAVTLNRYDTLQLINSSVDFTGTLIVSDKPIAALSGNAKANTFDTGSVDHLEEMLIPVNVWGRRFAMVTIPTRSISHNIKIVGYEANTDVKVYYRWHTGNTREKTFTLVNPGDWVVHGFGFLKENTPCSVFASKPVSVFFINPSMQFVIETTGPSLVQVPAFQHYQTKYIFKTPLSSLGETYTNYVMLFIKATETEGLRIDDRYVNITYTTVPFTEFVTGSVAIDVGFHVLRHVTTGVGFGAIFYGNRVLEAYVLPAGMKLIDPNGPCYPTEAAAGDGLDNDCDGAIDEETCTDNNTEDNDNDGHVNEDCAALYENSEVNTASVFGFHTEVTAMQLTNTIVLVVLANVAYGNITGEHPHSGVCLCVSGSSVNARDNPGLHGTTPIASLSSGHCYTFHGGILTKDGYTWYQLQNVKGHNTWLAGTYLVHGTSAQCSGSTSGGSTCSDAAAQDYACKILAFHNSGNIALWNRHPSGEHDNAYALNNIQDTCNGHSASRSHYTCSECRSPGAPGGHVCLSRSLLDYIYSLASKGYIHVNEIAGACHSCHSHHYTGTAVDLHNDDRSSEMLSTCTSMGGWGQNEGNHIHCQF